MVEIFDVSYSVFKQAAQITTVYYLPIVQNGEDGYFAGTGDKIFVYTSKILDSGDVSDFIDTFVGDGYSVLVDKHDDVIASPTIQIFNNIKRFDLTDDSFIYVGSAEIGTLDSEAKWAIQRFQLDNNGNVIDKQVTRQNAAVWDNRTLEEYF